jgi:ParB family transcriptional regulator, chromosome partitioning protein
MQTVEIPIKKLREAPWNPNQMDEAMLERLKRSLDRYGLVEPLVVRPIENHYEVLSGNQRLKAIKQIGFTSVTCVVVNLKDEEAMLLAQALNNLKGEDDLALKGTLLEDILKTIPQNEILSLLPETVESLQMLSSIGKEELAAHLQAWEEAQAARLKHMQLQFTHQQLETVEEAVSLITPKAKDDSFNNPNTRGNAIFLLCKFYLERRETNEEY